MKAIPPEHSVAQARSGRAMCRRCKKQIARGEPVLQTKLRYKRDRARLVFKHLACAPPEIVHALQVPPPPSRHEEREGKGELRRDVVLQTGCSAE